MAISDEEYIAFLQSLETLSTKPYDADQLLEMLGSYRTSIVGYPYAFSLASSCLDRATCHACVHTTTGRLKG
jgi:hypothetical protein